MASDSDDRAIAMRRRLPRPPEARPDDEVEDFFGVAVTTPYRWLDDPATAETRAWVDAQNALTDGFLGTTRRDQHVRFFERWSEEALPCLPIERGGCAVWLEQRGDQEQPSLWWRGSGADAPQLVVDVAAAGASIEAELVSLSPSGRYVAYGLASGGADGAAILVWDSAVRRTLPEVVATTAVPTVAWHPSEQGFFYNVTRRIIGADPAGQGDGVYWHRLGQPTSSDLRLLALDPERADAGPIHGLHPFVPEGGRVLYVAAINFTSGARGLSCWTLEDEPEVGLGIETSLFRDAEARLAWLGRAGTEHYFQTRLGAARGRVVAIDLEHPPRECWRVVVPEQADSLTTDSYTVHARCGVLCRDRLLLTYLHHASHRVRVFDLAGGELGELPLPPLVTVDQIATVDGRGGLSGARIATSDLLHPQVIYRWSAGEGAGELVVESALPSPLDPEDFDVGQSLVAARDGARIPLTVVRPRSRDSATPAPTLLYGYGGFGQSITPRYSPDAARWLAIGGVYAYANIRGGGEYGDAWHDAAKGAKRQTAFDDFQDVASRLIADGVTAPDLLGIKGLSNGGLLTAVCHNQRPDLFAAVIAEIPLADVMWLDKTDKGRAVAAEMANPRQSRCVFEALRAYSPLQNVAPAKRKPALLVVVAENDDSAPPGQAYRFTAACQAAASDGQLVLLRTLPGVGHVGWPRRVMQRALAEEVAFLEAVLMDHEGVGAGSSAGLSDRR